MSEGDKRVEQYMVEVAKVIDHRGWSQEAETQIYNRCYEAIWKVIRDYSAERDKYKAEALAAKQLCKIYYDIASSVLSEDEIRSKRDDAINKIKEG